MNGPSARPAPVPLTLVAGFPGAGKTRLIRQWLAARPQESTRALFSGAETAGFAADGGRSALPAGCLCCTGATGVLAALEDLLRQRDNHRIAPFDWMLIELDGLADPVPALSAITRHPYLALRYALTGMVTLIDPRHAGAALARHALARRQVALAHHLIASRETAPALPAALQAELARLNPLAAADIGATPDAAAVRATSFSTARWPEEERRAYHAIGLAGTLHARRSAPLAEQHRSAAEEWVFEHAQPLPDAALGQFLERFAHQFGPRLIRLSGRVAMADTPGVTWVEMVMGQAEPPAAMASAGTGTHLVLLAEAGAKAEISTALSRVFSAKV